MPHHEQVYIKVNAPVDRGIAGIVSALSEFPELRTIESCEDIMNFGCGWVCFCLDNHGRNRKPITDFVMNVLWPGLHYLDNATMIELVTNTAPDRAQLYIRHGHFDEVEAAIRRLAWEGNICGYHPYMQRALKEYLEETNA